MSSEIKSEDESSPESDDNLEVLRPSSGPLQTYRPHKRAQTAENVRRAKQLRLETNGTTENTESSGSERQNNNNSVTVPIAAQSSTQTDPEDIVVISDSDDDDIEITRSNPVRIQAGGRRIPPEPIPPLRTFSEFMRHVASDDVAIIRTHSSNHEDGHLPPVRNFTEFMRHVAGVNIDPPGLHLQPSRLSPQQRIMWLRQQADAENRRRRATSNPARYIPFVAEAVNPGDNTSNALYRIHIGPPIMQTIQTRLPRELQEERQRICVARTIINRYSVLYSFTGSNTENHEQKSCVVCITEFQNGQDVRRLPCMHIFHKECVDKWIIHSMKCPICRYNLLGDDETS